MPIYSYECPRCGEKSETVRSIAERDDDLYCTPCNANPLLLAPIKLRRVSTAPASTFPGAAGWRGGR
jgi:putative FmdB family regulatory protein